MEIIYGYDRQQKMWAVEMLDNNGNTIQREYVFNMDEVKTSIQFLKEDFEILSVKKIKAY